MGCATALGGTCAGFEVGRGEMDLWGAGVVNASTALVKGATAPATVGIGVVIAVCTAGISALIV
ncbi:MAG: hypothetical protein ACRDQ1_03530 [Sciscionella sp.]